LPVLNSGSQLIVLLHRNKKVRRGKRVIQRTNAHEHADQGPDKRGERVGHRLTRLHGHGAKCDDRRIETEPSMRSATNLQLLKNGARRRRTPVESALESASKPASKFRPARPPPTLGTGSGFCMHARTLQRTQSATNRNPSGRRGFTIPRTLAR
jgi:hypothetical protein